MRSITRTAVALAVVAASLGGASVASAAKGAGGGGGGGGGGGTTTVTGGAIRSVSAAAACDAGTVLGVSLGKGFDKRVEVVMNIAPSADGRWEFHLDNATNGAMVLGYATSMGSGGTARITVLGASVPVGVSELSFVATRRDQGSTLDVGSPITPVAETCTANFVVVGR